MKGEIQKGDRQRFYNIPVNLRLKHIAIGFIVAAIVLMLCMILWLDDIPPRLMLIMRGTVGLCALVFVILIAVLEYRVWRDYLNEK